MGPSLTARAAASLLVVLGCPAIPGAREAPAVLVDPTPRSRAALSEAVREALQGAPVTLADDALTRESLLVIEPSRPRDAAGRPLQGRELRAPERFRLVKSGNACVLVHEGTGGRYVLAGVPCSPR